MDWKILAGTFGLVFLAELGDKTQLTALAFSAGSKSTWSVFVGASLALILSTLVAVLLGSLLNQQDVVPLNAIKIVAGILFLVFGALTLREGFRPEKTKSPADASAVPSGVVAWAALEAASGFESATADHYLAAAEREADPQTRDLFKRIAAEESVHLARIRQLVESDSDALQAIADKAEHAPAAPQTPADEVGSTSLSEFVKAEENTARFYEELAVVAHIPSVKSVFNKLAEEEWGHHKELLNLSKCS